MKKTMGKNIIWKVAVIAALICSCNDNPTIDSDNDNDSETISEDMDSLQIPLAFDWLAISNVNMKVTASNDYPGENYIIEVFDHNPIINNSASLLAKDLVVSGQTHIGQINVPDSIKFISIRETDIKGMQLVREYAIINKSVDADFNMTLRASLSKILKNASEDGEDGEGASDSHQIPSGSMEIKNDGGVNSFELDPSKKKSYVINGNYSGAITFKGGGKGVELYIAGTWDNKSASISMGDNDKLIIMPGAKITTGNDLKINMSKSALFHVSKGASFNDDDSKIVEISGTNDSEQLINFGSCKVRKVSQLMTVQNNGTMKIGTLSCNHPKGMLVNNSKLTIDDADITGGTVNNNCQMIVNNKIACQNSTNLNLKAGTLLKTRDMDCGGIIVNMDGGSILNVTGTSRFKTQTTKIQGKGSSKNYSLVRFAQESSDVDNAVEYSGYVQIACSSHSQNTSSKTSYKLNSNSGATMVPYNSTTVTIDGGSCNDGGDKASGGGNSGNPTYPQTVNIGTIYTYLFEDLYPSVGDYDMNDCVIDANISYVLSASNKMSQININFTFKAAGSTKHLAAAVQLDGISASNVASVTRTGVLLDHNVFIMSSNGVEANQTYAVIPIVDDVHAAFGKKAPYSFINTRPSDPYTNPINVNLAIKFSTPIDITNTNVLNRLNTFLMNKFSPRQEIHIKNYKPTDKTKDISSNGNYSTIGNLVFGMCVPGPFKYPVEYKNILYAYPQFKAWMMSNSSTNQNWQMYPFASYLYNR